MQKLHDDEKLNVAVLMGGVSPERDISLKSGRAVADALEMRGHKVHRIDIRQKNIAAVTDAAPDLAFIALHGEFGEDGQVQALLDDARIPYTGSCAAAARTGMDKKASKRAFLRSAVPPPPYTIIDPAMPTRRALAQGEAIGFPIVCKPPLGGSSINVSIAADSTELRERVENWKKTVRPPAPAPEGEIGSAENELMLEKYIHGRELTVGILGEELLPVVEIISPNAFFDYSAKYEDAGTEYHVPVSLIESVYRRVWDAARRAYMAVGCRHMARVDMIYGYDGGVYVLELNTIPGLTSRSLLPMAARYHGIEFPALCEKICRLAVDSARLQAVQDITIPRRRSA